MLGENKGTDEPVFKCKESQLPISNTMELLGLATDEKLKFEREGSFHSFYFTTLSLLLRHVALL